MKDTNRYDMLIDLLIEMGYRDVILLHNKRLAAKRKEAQNNAIPESCVYAICGVCKTCIERRLKEDGDNTSHEELKKELGLDCTLADNIALSGALECLEELTDDQKAELLRDEATAVPMGKNLFLNSNRKKAPAKLDDRVEAEISQDFCISCTKEVYGPVVEGRCLQCNMDRA